MRKIILGFLIAFASVSLFAQSSNSIVTEIDYFNALRYTGARNIARTTDGYAVVVYEPGSDYTNQEIWYACYNKSFEMWNVSQLSNSVTGATGVPAAIADMNGKIHCSWKEQRESSAGERSLMYSELNFTDEFTYTWSDPLRVDTFAFNNPGVNTINLDDSGNPFILYSVWDDGSTYEANIFATKKIDGHWSTDNLTQEFPTPNALPFNYLDVNLATGTNGEMFAAWEDKPTEVVSQYEILFSHYTPANGWTMPEIISPLYDGTGIDKYDDGYIPVEGATPIYNMGPEDYVLAGNTTVLYNETATSKSIVSSFNPYYIFPVSDQQQYLTDVINFFNVTNADSILLVDDDNKYNNENIVTNVIDAMGIPYRVFDCGDNSGMATNIPSYANDLSGKKLVIWFTGDEYKDLAFWNISKSVNEELKTYLDTEGAQLFVIGKSWMYDVYGTAPDTLKPGDFAYDYFGISIYNVQAWSDDGNQGVPQLEKVENNLGVCSLENIGWKNSGTRQGVPSLTADNTNKVHITYKDDVDGSIKYQTYENGVWSTALRIDMAADTIFVDRPNISVDSGNGVYVIWRQETEEINGNKVYNVFYRTSPDGGLTWNDPVQLSTCSFVNSSGYSTYRASIGYQVVPEITDKFDGGADVVWVEASEASSMGYYIMYGFIPYAGEITGVDDNENLPLEFTLAQNYPNPFNPATTIEFVIPQAEQVSLCIFNSLGQKVATLVNENLQAGQYTKQWNAINQASGVYFAKLTAGNYFATKKLILLK